MLYGLGRCGARMKHQRNPHERCRADSAGKVEDRHERPGASNDGEQRQGGLRIGTPPFSIRNCLALSAAVPIGPQHLLTTADLLHARLHDCNEALPQKDSSAARHSSLLPDLPPASHLYRLTVWNFTLKRFRHQSRSYRTIKTFDTACPNETQCWRMQSCVRAAHRCVACTGNRWNANWLFLVLEGIQSSQPGIGIE
jgi:hypothetical protein